VTPEGRKATVVLIAGAVLAITVGLLGPALLGAAAGPETEVITWLKRTEADGLVLEIAPGAQLRSGRHYFDRIVVDVEPEQGRALATSTLDFEGKLGRTKVSSLGLEQAWFRPERGGWAPEESPAPILQAAVRALEARRRALEVGQTLELGRLSGGHSAPGDEEAVRAVLALERRRYHVAAWYIRSEREGVVVTEEYRVEGVLPDRPVDEKGLRRLRLEPKGGEFFFAGGLM
jgi:hypothetical protein